MSINDTKPKMIKFGSNNYYLAEEIYKYDSKCFIGMAICKNIRTIITKKNLKPEDYTFGYVKESKWLYTHLFK